MVGSARLLRARRASHRAEGAGHAVDDRDAVQQRARGDRAQHEILHGRLGGDPDSRSNATIAYSDSDSSSTPRYTVSRLPGRDHHHDAEQRDQAEDEVLALEEPAPLQVLARIQERDATVP